MDTYFLGNNHNSLVKIGRSADVPQRVKGITGSLSWVKIHIIHVIKGNYENQFHKAFAEYRKDGEWFDIPGLSVDMIEAHFTNIKKHSPNKRQRRTKTQKIMEDLCERLTKDFSANSIRSWMNSCFKKFDINLNEDAQKKLDAFNFDGIHLKMKDCSLLFGRKVEPIKWWGKNNDIEDNTCELYFMSPLNK